MLFHVLKLCILLSWFAPDEEKKAGYFSPEFNSHACELHADGEFNYLRNPAHSSAMCFRSSSYLNSHATSKDNLCKTAGQVESHDNDTIHTKQNSDRDLSQIKPVARQEKEQVSVADLLCAACKQLLFRPVILNCGHGMLLKFLFFSISITKL